MARLRGEPSYRLFKINPNNGDMQPVGTLKYTSLECFQMLATIGQAFLEQAPDLSSYGVYRKEEGGWVEIESDFSGMGF